MMIVAIWYIFRFYKHGSRRRLLCYLHLYILSYCVEAYFTITKNQLSESILHYEPLQYESEDLISNHERGLETLKFSFKAYHRTFNIQLKRDTSLFTHDLHVETVKSFQPGNIYDGLIVGEPLSSVHGFIYGGIFEGVIYTEDENEFHIESVNQYKHLDNQTIHSIIYNVKDIVQKAPSQCGGKKAGPADFNTTTIWDEINVADEKIRFSPNHGRERRAVASDGEKECHMYIRADHTYVKYADNDNNRALYLLSQHVKRVNKMYQDTDFNGDGSADSYSLKIKRIGIIDSSQCKNGDSSQACQLKPQYIGVEKYLEIASRGNYNQYCLSYLVAHRDFSDGVLGLAWIGDPSSAGGICDRHQSYSGVMKSLNTGIVSNLNYGKSVPSKVTDVTLAHEIGHNFGSQHDPLSGSCSPGGSSGNYIMYPRATSGSQGNNNRFSSCSIKSMWKVITTKGRRCFKKEGEAICGNRVKEKGEDCDCGYDNEKSCRDDQCCEGAKTDGRTGGCTFKYNKVKGIPSHRRCSPSNYICCNGATCQPYGLYDRAEICAQSNDCSEASKCASDSFEKCPAAQKKPNKALCNNDANTCVDGECSGSLCAIKNMVDCQCPNEKDLCHVCCQDVARRRNCTVYVNPKNENVKRPPGSPCENYEGYCDILHICRKVDAEGPLSRLKKWLFSPKSFDNILDWMKEYWWACILIGLGSIFLMVVFIAFCSVHTPSSNPSKPQARPLTLRPSRRTTRPTAPPASSANAPENPPGYETAIRDKLRSQPAYEMR